MKNSRLFEILYLLVEKRAVTAGELALRLNTIRTQVRETELAAMAAFEAPGESPRPDIIRELKEIRVGLNMNPDEEWDLSLEVLTENRHDLEIYANHPAHQQIVKHLIAPLKEDRACVDYQV